MKTTNSYTRVIPRDLFNEAKCLKCFGRLCLLIHDRMAPDGVNAEHHNDEENPDGEFRIVQCQDGELTIYNLVMTINEVPVLAKTKYNSKANYPMYVEHEYVDYLVFNEDGEFTDEFKDFVQTFTE